MCAFVTVLSKFANRNVNCIEKKYLLKHNINYADYHRLLMQGQEVVLMVLTLSRVLPFTVVI